MTPDAPRPLEGKVAVVAGASRAIGKGIAWELAEAGAFVYLPGRVPDPPEIGESALTVGATAAEIEADGGSAAALACDFTDEGQIAAVFARVAADHGHLDILVNSVFSSPSFGASIGKAFWELPLSFWREVVDLGTGSAYMASVAAAPLLLASDGGLIVNVSARGADR
jgi:dehydrogenase/reductase SDR family protein 1